MRNKLIARLAAGLLLAEAALVLTSWILSATMTGGVRSLLSDVGIRWFLGRFVEMMASPLLVWLVLLLIAFGSFLRSGLAHSLRCLPERRGATSLNYRDRTALRLVAVILVLYVIVILLLTVTPHAILLSATGSLFPSPFSRAIVPLAAFGLSLVSVVYGVMSGRFTTLSDILDSLSYGIRRGAPLFILYILAVQFIESLLFVFG